MSTALEEGSHIDHELTVCTHVHCWTDRATRTLQHTFAPDVTREPREDDLDFVYVIHR